MREFYDQLEYLMEKKVKAALKEQGARMSPWDIKCLVDAGMRKLAAQIFIVCESIELKDSQ